MTFTLRNPRSEDPQLRSSAEVLSRHKSLAAAQRALSRYQNVAERQGCGCDAYIWNDEQDRLVTTAELVALS